MNKSTVYSLVLAFLLRGSNSFAQQLGFRIINGQKRVRIPFELYSNLIVVPVILNNQLPLKFVLALLYNRICPSKMYSSECERAQFSNALHPWIGRPILSLTHNTREG